MSSDFGAKRANRLNAAQRIDADHLLRSIEFAKAMAASLSPPRLLPSGDSAVTVEFSRNIDDAANQRVLALDRTLAREPVAGVTETGADLSIAAGAL